MQSLLLETALVLLLNLLGAMYSAVIFLGATNTNSVQPVVAIERTVFYRERAAGMYSEMPYAIAQVKEADLCFVYFTLYGMMTVALTPNHQIAAIVMSFFLSFWNLFSGFLIARTQIPIWWRWYYWASPVAWTIYGLVTSQVGDKESLVQVPGERPISVKGYLEKQMGFEYSFLGEVAVAHIAFTLLFLIVFAYGIKFILSSIFLG